MGGRLIHPAQTNLALYAQLHAAGYPAEDLRRAQRAYGLATELFAGTFRGTGKPFVCHAVGTASVAAAIGLGIVPVLAGLLHAAFEHGMFPDGRSGPTAAHRAHVAAHVGADVADLVAAYEAFSFGNRAIKRLLQDPPKQEPSRTVAILQLANEVDDLTDAGLSVAPKHGDFAERARDCAELARRLGQDVLAAEITRLAGAGTPSWTRALDPTPLYSYRLLPRLRAYLTLRRRKRNTRVIK